MSSKLLLRIAALLIVVHLLGHVMGHLAWDKPEDPKMGEVVAAMKGYSAEFMGANKSMADYYQGYSLMIFGIFGLAIALLWMASGILSTHRDIARKMMLPVGIVFLFFGCLEFIYFFPFAAGTSFLAGLLVVVAVAKK